MNKSHVTSLIKSGAYEEAACLLLAACERTPALTGPSDAFKLFSPWAGKKQEHFLVATLDGAHQVIDIHVVSQGLANKTMVHPREVFRPAILDSACAIIIAHNHPSGKLEPSPEDGAITTRLKDAGELIGIEILDHVIVSRKGAVSLRETTSLLD